MYIEHDEPHRKLGFMEDAAEMLHQLYLWQPSCCSFLYKVKPSDLSNLIRHRIRGQHYKGIRVFGTHPLSYSKRILYISQQNRESVSKIYNETIPITPL